MVLVWSFMFMFLVVVICIASNPSPFFGALSLLLAVGFICFNLVSCGLSYLALLLLLIYLGGMVVVFGYSAAFSSDLVPEGFGDTSVSEFITLFIGGLVVSLLWMGPPVYMYAKEGAASIKALLVTQSDVGGVSMFYGTGGMLIFYCGWVLFLTLFVVLELIRTRARGAMRQVK
nr:NADH dehydrogenase subunit 6 [Herklotsichthys quadrimaculatus]